MTDVAPWRLLRRFLSVPRISGTCANAGTGLPERLVQQHVLRRVRDVIVAADHVRDRHVDVVGDDRQVIGRLAVGAQDHEIFDVARCRTRSARARDRRTRPPVRDQKPDRARRAGRLEPRDLVRRRAAGRCGRTSIRRPRPRRPGAWPAASRSSSSSSRRGRRRRADRPPRGICRDAATGSTARAARRRPGLRPSRAPASAGRRRCRRPSPRTIARRRCLRSAARTCRRGAGRTAS